MGINAVIMVRTTGEKPTRQQLKKWSWHIAESIGADKFFICDGLDQPEYEIANEAWHKAFNEHPLYYKWKIASLPYEEKQAVHKAIIADIGEPVEQRRLALDLTNYRYPLDEESGVPKEYWEPGRAMLQDGDTLLAGPDEWFMEFSLWTRYYGIGYERGDLLTLCAIAEWCEANIPGCIVWYGGDSSGVEVEPWDADKRFALRKHMYSQNGREYFSHKTDFFGHPKPCGLCISSNNFSQYGFGKDYSAVHCAGCGKSFETRDRGVTWVLKKKDDA